MVLHAAREADTRHYRMGHINITCLKLPNQAAPQQIGVQPTAAGGNHFMADCSRQQPMEADSRNYSLEEWLPNPITRMSPTVTTSSRRAGSAASMTASTFN